MFAPKIFLSRGISQDELFEIVEDGLGINEVKEVIRNLNKVEILTESSRFELRMEGKELSIYQRWNKDKMWIVVGIIAISLFIWIPFLFLFYLMFEERKISEEILNRISEKINN